MSGQLQDISRASSQASKLLATASAAMTSGGLGQVDGELLTVMVEKFQVACEEAEEVAI